MIGENGSHHSVIIISSCISLLNRFDPYRSTVTLTLNRISYAVFLRQNIYAVVPAPSCDLHIPKAAPLQQFRTKVFKVMPLHQIHVLCKAALFSAYPPSDQQHQQAEQKNNYKDCNFFRILVHAIIVTHFYESSYF